MSSIAARCTDAREAATWIHKRLEKDELAIEPKAITLLLSSTGLSLGRIRRRSTS
jgi:DNA polymerase III delta subunit